MCPIRAFLRPWRKSSYSAADGNCVEVRRLLRGYIGVRDSKSRSPNALRFATADWRTFIEEVKRNYPDSALNGSS
jgi:hypothetical protein